ncbi:hypothetical protein PENANT_c018G07410 [Penicillium antarcticum]|uniref:Uncharacterized protein n=1 Tax=Penicillium antarcticum TaxID=416450 RepID=A0A1V6Q373_9EURO|nr:hypothetical protein PENANT_c018G07410 [Penicillium antarcticum]
MNAWMHRPSLQSRPLLTPHAERGLEPSSAPCIREAYRGSLLPRLCQQALVSTLFGTLLHGRRAFGFVIGLLLNVLKLSKKAD